MSKNAFPACYRKEKRYRMREKRDSLPQKRGRTEKENAHALSKRISISLVYSIVTAVPHAVTINMLPLPPTVS